jgi:hypothetical protein
LEDGLLRRRDGLLIGSRGDGDDHRGGQDRDTDADECGRESADQ